MHVAGLNLFRFPARVHQRRFMSAVDDCYRTTDEFRKPFGHRVAHGMLGRFGPLYWEEDPDIDLEYHVRHSALPKPGRYRELFSLVSRLHATLLDRSRPLWEVHLIEGLQNREFAVYTKLQRADELARRYRISSVPTIIVNGKYVTSATMAGSYPVLLEVIDELIAMERAGE